MNISITDAILLVLFNTIGQHFGLIMMFVVTMIFKKWVKYFTMDSISDSVNTKATQKYIRDNVSYCSNYNVVGGKKYPIGICISFSKMFLAYVESENKEEDHKIKRNVNIKILTFKDLDIKKKKKIGISVDDSEDDNDNEEESKTKIDRSIKLYLTGTYYSDDYEEVIFPMPYNFTPRDYQSQIIKIINQEYQNHPFSICRVLISGQKNLGKSMVAKFLAKELKTSLCFDINLLLPGSPLINLYQQSSPDKDKPLIIQLDEFDIMIKNIHENKNIKSVNWASNKIQDKSSYNTFMSEYTLCLPYVIYVATTNEDFEWFDELDTSYTSPNRFDLKIKITSDHKVETIKINKFLDGTSLPLNENENKKKED